MKSNELQVGKEYAVIPSWEYSSANKKNPDKVLQNEVAKATLVSLDKYEYKVYRSQTANHQMFALAQKGSRSVGYIVASEKWADQPNGTGKQGTIYWLARAQDIVGEWSTLQPRWEKELQEEAEKQKRAREEQERLEEQRRIAEQNRQRYEKSTRDSLIALLGNRVTEKTVQFNHRHYSESEVSIEVSKDVFDMLIEKVLEAKDLVG